MKGRRISKRGNQRTAASSAPASVCSDTNSVCIGSIASAKGVSFGGLTRVVAPGVRDGVCTLFELVGVMASGIAPDKLPKNDPVTGARGSLGVVPETADGFFPKTGPGTTLESNAPGASVLAPGLGTRLDAPGLIPANRLGVVMVAGLVAPSAVDVVSGFGASEKPNQPGVGGGAIAAAPVAEEEGLLLIGIPFVVSSGGVLGLTIVDEGEAGLGGGESSKPRADFSLTRGGASRGLGGSGRESSKPKEDFPLARGASRGLGGSGGESSRPKEDFSLAKGGASRGLGKPGTSKPNAFFTLTGWSTDDSNVVGGDVNLTSSGGGESALAPPPHCPNGVFGDAGRGLTEAAFSPFTSSSSPPDTGAFARGELRTGRVLGLPRLLLELGDGDGDGEREGGDGSVGVGC